MSSAFIQNIYFLSDESIHWSPQRLAERDLAIKELLQKNHFLPKNLQHQEYGPFDIHMTLDDQRIVIRALCLSTQWAYQTKLPLQHFRRLIRDYFLLCDRHREALEVNNLYGLEAMDMGRRAIHNEGAETIIALFEEHFIVDFDTARRFFTLICACHYKNHENF